MKKAFYTTDEIRRKNLIEASITEFSNENYQDASMNKIIKAACISKGGLFKYIDGKEDLYLYTVEVVLKDIIDFQFSSLQIDESCYLDRTYRLLSRSIDYSKENPKAYKLLLQVSFDISSPLMPSVMDIRSNMMNRYQDKLVAGIDWSTYSVTQDLVIEHVKLIVDGFNLQLFSQMQRVHDHTSLENMLKNLKVHF